MGFGLLLGFGYWAFSPLLVGNTLGKSVFGLQLVSVDETPMSPRNAILQRRLAELEQSL